MSHEVIHTLGSTSYFVFMLLFVWTSRIPRTNPGASSWAALVSCALLARLSLFFLTYGPPQKMPLAVYVVFNVLE